MHRATKTAESDDTLPLPSIVIAALEKRRREQLADRRDAEVAWHPTDLVFTTKYGRPIEPRNFNRSWDNRVARSGVRKITVHDGRRSCGTLLVDLDVHPRVIMRILRHAQFSLTMEIYSQASSKTTRDALKRLGESLDE
ncbi:tyrosine-type recombinase/integrase [Amycolatopsis mediterranei]|uniref:tyrosine-type recombinase/integrase n=1 Tax=Amycolatopsis mediterranei TaxID=33910 RepID=UPI00341CFBAA